MTPEIIGCCALIAISLAIIVYTLVRKSPVRPSPDPENPEKTSAQIAAEEAAEDFKE